MSDGILSRIAEERDELRRRLQEAEDTLRAIRVGDVDAVVVQGPDGPRVFTLKDADRPYRLMVEEMREAALTIDEHGIVLYCNRYTAELLDRPLTSLLGDHVQNAIAPASVPRFEAMCRDAMAGTSRGEISMIAGDGRVVPVLLAINRLPEEDSGALCLVAADLSQQKRTEEIEASATLLRSILDQSVEGIVVCDAKGVITQINPAAAALTAPGAVGRTFGEAFPLRRADADDGATIAPVLRGALIERLEVSLRGPAGTALHLLFSAAPLIGSGQVDGCVVGLTDITARRSTEAALRLSESHFRTLTEATPQLVWTARIDGRRDYVNSAWAEYTGQEAGTETPWHDSIHPADRRGAGIRWQAALRSGRDFVTECRIRRADGAYRWHLGRAAPVREPDGTIVKWIGTFTDIDDLKALEHERDDLLARERVARLEAERANGLKDEFLATLSHELRTPLNVILSWVSLLRTGRLGPKDVNDGIDVIDRNARAQVQLIEDLLDMSRIVSGKLRLDIAPVALAAVVEAAVDGARPGATAKHVDIAVDVDPVIPSMQGDAIRLQQIIWNLLNNAVRFTPAGGHVRVGLHHENESIRLVVADDGIGIRPEFLPHVFDRFAQADASTTRRHSGLGIGLAIVRRLAELHGGSVHVSSPGEGQGATFTVRLPLVPVSVAAGDDRLVLVDPVAGAPMPSLDGVRVLVVDDEPDACQVLMRLFSMCGAEVTIAQRVNEALAAARRHRPDVVVSDIGMPDEDGYALMAQLREGAVGTPHPPVIALTAYARPEDRRLALLAGFEAHFPKPFDPRALIESVAVLARGTGGASPAA